LSRAIIVQKYGGSSVATPERIKNVADRIIKTRQSGKSVVVVVSAMGGTTDKLIGLAHQVNLNPPRREMDMLLATGEQVSSALLAMAIIEKGFDAISFTGPQVGIITDGFYSRAKIRNINETRLLEELEDGKIVIVAGFQGVTIDNHITTLGRGGSDTTAVAIAAALDAEMCDICTDVDGVYTANPKIVPNARKLDVISYDEMLEMARLGAKVLHYRSVMLAKKFNVPLRVRSSFNENKGTIVMKETEMMEEIVVSGVTSDTNQAKVSLRGVPDKPGIAARVFEEIGKSNINVDMIIQNASVIKNNLEQKITDLSFTVPKDDLEKTLEAAEHIKDEISATAIDVDKNVAKVSVIGIGMKTHVNVAAQMFRALAEENINIQMISTSDIKISCVIEEKYVERAVQVIHQKFECAGIASQK